MTDIEIPDAALDAATAAIGRSVWKPRALAKSVLRAASPALVAAELRRLHDAIAGTDMDRYDVLVLLDDRATELEDGAR